MLDLVRDRMEVGPVVSSGDRKPFVMETVKADDRATLGRGPRRNRPRSGWGTSWHLSLPSWARRGSSLGGIHWTTILLGTTCMCTERGAKARARQHVPQYSQAVIDEFNKDGSIDKLLAKGRR